MTKKDEQSLLRVILVRHGQSVSNLGASANAENLESEKETAPEDLDLLGKQEGEYANHPNVKWFRKTATIFAENVRDDEDDNGKGEATSTKKLRGKRVVYNEEQLALDRAEEDPHLTPRGQLEAEELGPHLYEEVNHILRHNGRKFLLVHTPLRRTVETMVGALRPLMTVASTTHESTFSWWAENAMVMTSSYLQEMLTIPGLYLLPSVDNNPRREKDIDYLLNGEDEGQPGQLQLYDKVNPKHLMDAQMRVLFPPPGSRSEPGSQTTTAYEELGKLYAARDMDEAANELSRKEWRATEENEAKNPTKIDPAFPKKDIWHPAPDNRVQMALAGADAIYKSQNWQEFMVFFTHGTWIKQFFQGVELCPGEQDTLLLNSLKCGTEKTPINSLSDSFKLSIQSLKTETLKNAAAISVALKKQAHAPGGFCIAQAKFVHCGRGKDPEETELANKLLPEDLLEDKHFIVQREDRPRMIFEDKAEKEEGGFDAELMKLHKKAQCEINLLSIRQDDCPLMQEANAIGASSSSFPAVGNNSIDARFLMVGLVGFVAVVARWLRLRRRKHTSQYNYLELLA